MFALVSVMCIIIMILFPFFSMCNFSSVCLFLCSFCEPFPRSLSLSLWLFFIIKIYKCVYLFIFLCPCNCICLNFHLASSWRSKFLSMWYHVCRYGRKNAACPLTDMRFCGTYVVLHSHIFFFAISIETVRLCMCVHFIFLVVCPLFSCWCAVLLIVYMLDTTLIQCS